MNTKLNITKIAALTATALVAYSFSTVAQAADPSVAPRVEINAKGYDLSTPEGVSALTGRAHQAAKQVCFGENDADLSTQMRQRSCYTKAVAQADVQISSLRSQFARRNGGPVETALLAGH